MPWAARASAAPLSWPAVARVTIWAVWALTLVAALPLRRGKEMAS